MITRQHCFRCYRCQDLLSHSLRERTKGSHHIFTKQGIPDIVNLQPGRDGKAKPYQVRQISALIVAYNLL